MQDANYMVGVIMGSVSDWNTMRDCCSILEELSISHEIRIVSAHRTPERLYEYASNAFKRGIRIIIAGAGGSAHLPGMTASMTTLPVIGVPIKSHSLNGIDSLLSIVQMPKGVPVGCVAIGNSGAANAALLAARILAINNIQIYNKLICYIQNMKNTVPYTITEESSNRNNDNNIISNNNITNNDNNMINNDITNNDNDITNNDNDITNMINNDNNIIIDPKHDSYNNILYKSNKSGQIVMARMNKCELKKLVYPLAMGSIIGIIGGGQLAKMMSIAAVKLGYKTHIYCPDKESPAFVVSHDKTIAEYNDETYIFIIFIIIPFFYSHILCFYSYYSYIILLSIFITHINEYIHK